MLLFWDWFGINVSGIWLGCGRGVGFLDVGSVFVVVIVVVFVGARCQCYGVECDAGFRQIHRCIERSRFVLFVCRRVDCSFDILKSCWALSMVFYMLTPAVTASRTQIFNAAYWYSVLGHISDIEAWSRNPSFRVRNVGNCDIGLRDSGGSIVVQVLDRFDSVHVRCLLEIHQAGDRAPASLLGSHHSDLTGATYGHFFIDCAMSFGSGSETAFRTGFSNLLSFLATCDGRVSIAWARRAVSGSRSQFSRRLNEEVLSSLSLARQSQWGTYLCFSRSLLLFSFVVDLISAGFSSSFGKRPKLFVIKIGSLIGFTFKVLLTFFDCLISLCHSRPHPSSVFLMGLLLHCRSWSLLLPRPSTIQVGRPGLSSSAATNS